MNWDFLGPKCINGTIGHHPVYYSALTKKAEIQPELKIATGAQNDKLKFVFRGRRSLLVFQRITNPAAISRVIYIIQGPPTSRENTVYRSIILYHVEFD